MKVFIVSPSATTIELQLDATSTITDVKDKLQDVEGITPGVVQFSIPPSLANQSTNKKMKSANDTQTLAEIFNIANNINDNKENEIKDLGPEKEVYLHASYNLHAGGGAFNCCCCGCECLNHGETRAYICGIGAGCHCSSAEKNIHCSVCCARCKCNIM